MGKDAIAEEFSKESSLDARHWNGQVIYYISDTADVAPMQYNRGTDHSLGPNGRPSFFHLLQACVYAPLWYVHAVSSGGRNALTKFASKE